MARGLNDRRKKANEESAESGSLAGGGKGAGYTALQNIPFQRFEPIKGRNVVDLILYPITNPEHPHVLAGLAAVGDLEMNLDISVHPRQGEEEVDLVCLLDSRIAPKCKACENMWAQYEQSNKDKNNPDEYWKAFKKAGNSRRWVIFLRPRLGPQAGTITWWNAPFSGNQAGFGSQVENKCKRIKEKNGRVIDYTSDGMAGESIEFFAIKGDKDKWFTYEEFDFVPREEEVSEALVDGMPDLSDFMIVSTNDEIDAYLEQGIVPEVFKNVKKVDASTNATPAKEEATSSAPATSSKAMRNEEKPEVEKPASTQKETPTTSAKEENVESAKETQQAGGNGCAFDREFGVGYRRCPHKASGECKNVEACFDAK